MKRASREDIDRRLAELETLDAKVLREHWQELFGCAAPKRMQRDLLLRAVAYRVQEKAFGGVKPATLRKLKQLAAAVTSTGRAEAPALQPGSQLMREWNNEVHRVDVVEGGFLWRDRKYPSLSFIAREITGARWSGPRFFGLLGKSGGDTATGARR
jgi:hypothetical protein